MADNAAHAESSQEPTEVAERLGLVRRFPFALALAALMSVVFVVIVAALIAFMQYQARLLRSQPGITANQLVYYVDTEKAIEEELKDITDLSKEISDETPKYAFASNEIEFRITRICSLFDSAPDAQNQKDKCRRFLNEIPFQGTTAMSSTETETTSGSGASGPGTEKKSPSDEPILAKLLESIRANFIVFMGVEKIGGVDFSELVSLFQSDIAKIAKLNQQYELEIRPNYLRMLQTYSAKCEHLLKLVGIVSTYRTIDPGCDPKLYASTLTADMQASEAAPRGGPIESPQGGPVQLGTQVSDPNNKQTPPAGALSKKAEPQPSSTGSEAPLSEPSTPPDQPNNSDAPNDATTTLPPASQAPEGGAPQGGPLQPNPQLALSPSDRQRAFELVTHYRFYDRISFSKLRDILISPNDFLALALVCVAGILGALLRIVFASYVSGKDPTLRSIVISPILGLICALVVYNLFRAGFIVITDQAQNDQTSVLSPFVIALLAMAAGLLSERTIALFRKTSDSWLGSVEGSQTARWAVNLQREMDAQSTTAEKLAERLDVSAAKLKDWAQEKEPVPVDKQRDLSLALNVPARRIFTDLSPPQPA